jgi:hypothetical protein
MATTPGSRHPHPRRVDTCTMVMTPVMGTLRFAHPTKLEPDITAASD